MTSPTLTPITQSLRYQKDLTKKKLPVWLQFFPPFWVVALVWFVVKIPVLIVNQKQRQEALHDFAQANSFTYDGVEPKVTNGKDAPITLDLPYENIPISRVFDRLSGKVDGLPFTYLATMLRVPTQATTSSRTMPVGAVFFTMRVPAKMPTLYIQSKQGFQRGLKLPATKFTHAQTYDLEGNFGRYYKIIGEEADRLDIYMVLSPEVMQALIAHSFYDIWMHDQEVTLIAYGAGREQYFTQIPTVFAFMHMLTAQVDRIARAKLRSRNPRVNL